MAPKKEILQLNLTQSSLKSPWCKLQGKNNEPFKG